MITVKKTLCPDVGNSVNDDAKTAAAAGTTKAFNIEYANGDPITVTEVSDSATLFEDTVPNPSSITSDVYYNRAPLTQTTSYNNYDEAWRILNPSDPNSFGGNSYNDSITE